MRDILMDTFKLGLGALDMTREEAARLVKKVQTKYPDEITDGRQMIDDLVAQGKKNAKAFEEKVSAEVQKAIKRQKLVDEKDLKELAANVRELARTTMKVGKQVGRKGYAAAKKGVKKAVKTAKKAGRKPAKKTAKRKAARKSPKKRKATKTTTKRKASRKK